MKYKMQCKAVGNPDFGQDPDAVLATTTIEAATMQSLSKKFRTWIGLEQLGGGNVIDPDVIENGKIIGRMSYNGKIWPLDRWVPGMEPIFEPR